MVGGGAADITLPGSPFAPLSNWNLATLTSSGETDLVKGQVLTEPRTYLITRHKNINLISLYIGSISAKFYYNTTALSQ